MKFFIQSLIILVISTPVAAQMSSEQQLNEIAIVRRQAATSEFYQYPIGKKFWIEPKPDDLISSRIAFYKSINPEKSDSWEFFIDPIYPEKLVSFTPIAYFSAGISNRIGRKQFAYSIKLDNGETYYINGERFGIEQGYSYLARDEAVKSKWILGVSQIESEKIYTDNPVALREKEERKKAEKALEAKRRGGVQIGMTKKQVLASNWGEPDSKNTTSTSRKVFEQWVYGNGNYLYFENGVLKTIQN